MIPACDCNSVSGLISRGSANSMATSDLDGYYRFSVELATLGTNKDVFAVKY